MDLPVQSFNLLSQDVVAGLLAEEHEEFADGAVDQLPFTDLPLTEGNEDNEDGGRATLLPLLPPVEKAAAGHASCTDLPFTGGKGAR
jgi:hypothetical protein